MLASPEPQQVFAAIEPEGVTITAVVPAVAAAVAGPRRSSTARVRWRRLRVLQVGGARLADELARQVARYWARPAAGVRHGRGPAELTRLDDPDEVICTTQGRPLCPADEVRIVDETDNDLPDGVPGALLTRGPYTPRGYYRAAEQNARAFTADGWYRSGDIVRRRPDGNLVVEGRDKDMINRGGEKICAEEVENLVYRLPEVAQVAAVAMPDPELGERVCVYVVPRPGRRSRSKTIRARMAAAGVPHSSGPSGWSSSPSCRPPRSARSTRRRCARTSLTAPALHRP